MIGVLLVDKSGGPTSHDVVAMARRALDTRRIGHTGTLDPFATGLLILCVGRATKLAEYLTGLEKSYEATARLGVTTDTLDRTGEVTAESDAWETVDPPSVRSPIEAQQGSFEQEPPAYSAKRLGGRKAYELARAGQDVQLSPVAVTIHELEVVDVDGPDVRFRLRCSSGTYVRAVARDAGATLGVGAHLTSLRRTAVGPHRVDDAVPPDALKAAGGDTEVGLDRDQARARIEAALLDPLDALPHLPRLELDENQLWRVKHGQSIEVPGAVEGLITLARDGALQAVAESNGQWVRPRKVLA